MSPTDGDPTRQCLLLYRIGRLEEADDLAREALGRRPLDGGLWQLHGLLRRQAGDFEGARAALETASTLVPLNPASRCALADCYAAAGRVELARWLYGELGDDPSCPTELLAPVAAGLGTVGEPSAALRACRELARRDDRRHEAHFGVAYYLRRLGRPAEEAIPAARRAFELAPRSPLYRVTLATLLEQAGHTDEAYDLLCDVDPAEIRCCRCLRRMTTIFQQFGDAPRVLACRSQAGRLGEPPEPGQRA